MEALEESNEIFALYNGECPASLPRSSSCTTPCASLTRSSIESWFVGKRQPLVPRIEEKCIELESLTPIYYGSSTAIYKGTCNGLDSAFKHPIEQQGREPSGVPHRLLAEAYLLNEKRGPRVVQIYGYVEEKRYIAIEWMGGGSVSQMLEKADALRLPPELRLKWILQISQAILWLHMFGRPVVHADLSLNNFLLDDDLNVKVSDLGMARFAREEDDLVSGHKEGKGNIDMFLYPPEMQRDKYFNPNFKTDIYQFGLIIWRLLTLTAPYGISEENQEEKNRAIRELREGKLRLHIDEARTKLPGMWKECVEPLIVLCRECTEPEPNCRPDDFKAIHSVVAKVYADYTKGTRSPLSMLSPQSNWWTNTNTLPFPDEYEYMTSGMDETNRSNESHMSLIEAALSGFVRNSGYSTSVSETVHGRYLARDALTASRNTQDSGEQGFDVLATRREVTGHPHSALTNELANQSDDQLVWRSIKMISLDGKEGLDNRFETAEDNNERLIQPPRAEIMDPAQCSRADSFGHEGILSWIKSYSHNTDRFSPSRQMDPDPTSLEEGNAFWSNQGNGVSRRSRPMNIPVRRGSGSPKEQLSVSPEYEDGGNSSNKTEA